MLELINSLYSALGIDIVANNGDLLGLGSVVLLILLSLTKLPTGQKEKSLEEEVSDKPKEKSQVEKQKPQESKEEPARPKVSWSERLSAGLSKSRSQVWGRMGSLFSSGGLSDEHLEEVEELLYGADIGPKVATELVEKLEERAKDQGFNEEEFKKFLFHFLKEKMQAAQSKLNQELYHFKSGSGLKVIMIVGVNGAGKTTTIGKLATKLTGQGAKVVVGACDTFRAAAVDQLQVWCDRANAKMIRAKEGSNPTGVGYDALQEAINSGADYCLLDTAGRLHTKGNLMEELSRSKEVLKKLDPNAPHEVLLVIDAITGQNALRQAEEFNKALDLTGFIFTKCDGSSKAGSAVGIVQSLQTPIAYIGVGESVEDLDLFDLDQYLEALLGISASTL